LFCERKEKTRKTSEKGPSYSVVAITTKPRQRTGWIQAQERISGHCARGKARTERGDDRFLERRKDVAKRLIVIELVF